MTPEPYDFEAELGTFAWLRWSMENDDFDNDRERWASVPYPLFDLLNGHLPFDPTTDTMKQYPTRESAIEAFKRAMDAWDLMSIPMAISADPA